MVMKISHRLNTESYGLFGFTDTFWLMAFTKRFHATTADVDVFQIIKCLDSIEKRGR